MYILAFTFYPNIKLHPLLSVVNYNAIFTIIINDWHQIHQLQTRELRCDRIYTIVFAYIKRISFMLPEINIIQYNWSYPLELSWHLERDHS